VVVIGTVVIVVERVATKINSSTAPSVLAEIHRLKRNVPRTVANVGLLLSMEMDVAMMKITIVLATGMMVTAAVKMAISFSSSIVMTASVRTQTNKNAKVIVLRQIGQVMDVVMMRTIIVAANGMVATVVVRAETNGNTHTARSANAKIQANSKRNFLNVVGLYL